MKTAIGYKLFRVSKKYPGKLFPLYVNANTNIPIGEWISAEPGERLENGKVKSKLGPLRYRPGFHINDVAPYVSHIGQKVNGKILICGRILYGLWLNIVLIMITVKKQKQMGFLNLENLII